MEASQWPVIMLPLYAVACWAPPLPPAMGLCRRQGRLATLLSELEGAAGALQDSQANATNLLREGEALRGELGEAQRQAEQERAATRQALEAAARVSTRCSRLASRLASCICICPSHCVVMVGMGSCPPQAHRCAFFFFLYTCSPGGHLAAKAARCC